MVKRTWMVALVMSAAMASGCSTLNNFNEWMIQKGILLPSARRVHTSTGINPDSVLTVAGPSGRGVGVVVEQGLVLTSAHVCPGQRASVYQRAWADEGVDAKYEAKVVWHSTKSDLALLEVPLELTQHTSAPPSDGSAWLIRPRARSRMAQGYGGHGVEVLRVELSKGTRYRMLEGATRPGDSGSPIVQCGRVVGVVRTATEFAPAGEVAVAAARTRQPLDRERFTSMVVASR